MLIITGLGRCGTSFLAKFCDNMGYRVGGRWFAKYNAGWENVQVQSINHEIHMSIDKNTKMKKGILMQRMAKFKADVIKDPGFMKIGGIHNETIRMWWEMKPSIKFLILSRNIYTIEESYVSSWGPNILKRNNGHNTAESLFRARDGFYDIIEELGIPYNDALDFPDFLDQYEKVYNILTFMGLKFKFENGLTQWNKLRNDNLVHFKSTTFEPKSRISNLQGTPLTPMEIMKEQE